MFKSQAKTNVSDALRRYEGGLLRYATAIVGPTLARDVVQDTFLRLCAQEEDLSGRLAPWLFSVCRNRAIDVRRKRSRHAELPEEMEIPAPAIQHTRVEQKQLLARAMKAMGQLSERRREVVLLKFSAELSYKEIAEVTGISVSNVGVILHETLKTLRAELHTGSVSKPQPDDASRQEERAITNKRRAL